MNIVAVVGSYRKGGTIDQAVDEVLAAARDAGATTSKIYLIDTHIEYCHNCRACMQEPGDARGKCVIADEMDSVLDQIERADAIVLGSPVNFGTVTAVMKTFIERTARYGYWPWGTDTPVVRNPEKKRKAVVIASSAAPGFLARFAYGIVGLLKKAAEMLGAKTIGVLFIGLAAHDPIQRLDQRARKKARVLGARLVAPR